MLACCEGFSWGDCIIRCTLVLREYSYVHTHVCSGMSMVSDNDSSLLILLRSSASVRLTRNKGLGDVATDSLLH